MSDALAFVPAAITLLAICGQAVAIAYWGGRLAATLDGLAHRVGRLEETLTHRSPHGSIA
jgi:hypothetical protein